MIELKLRETERRIAEVRAYWQARRDEYCDMVRAGMTQCDDCLIFTTQLFECEECGSLVCADCFRQHPGNRCIG